IQVGHLLHEQPRGDLLRDVPVVVEERGDVLVVLRGGPSDGERARVAGRELEVEVRRRLPCRASRAGGGRGPEKEEDEDWQQGDRSFHAGLLSSFCDGWTASTNGAGGARGAGAVGMGRIHPSTPGYVNGLERAAHLGLLLLCRADRGRRGHVR